jgi:mono/diheme cytochrome c family protein
MRLAVVALLCLLPANAPAQDRLRQRGAEIADRHCGRCHVVDTKNRMRGISSTPSFPLLVRALPDWRERFQTFFARRPHPAVIRIEGIEPPTKDPPTTVPVELTPDDVDAIVAYAEALAAAESSGTR